jgi:hypothetical protein
MELWSNGMMGLKEFFTIKMVYFRLYPQYSSIPAFHSDVTKRLPLQDYLFHMVVEIPKRLIITEARLKPICFNEPIYYKHAP